MNVETKVLKRFVIYMAILTFVMFTVWGFVKSFMNRPPGDYETEVCDIRLKDKKYEEALKAANEALNKTPYHRGAMMCKALIFISEKRYIEADNTLTNLINSAKENNASFISDEIYHGIQYENNPTSALEITDECYVINSFSKYFSVISSR